ncbi:pilus assembly protein [Telluria mixta]|uniref:Pilus assembly protein n=1 Tax=Telluria mixta TaxID=34071 RepID=A0ABT2BSC4_9BURK|nr:pilus assembly protein [Telluria mixta]MCS0628019.1 pilus assembly protein [Telluria mixta]WEM93864.1 pilus assembly protein [Telluria mixta]
MNTRQTGATTVEFALVMLMFLMVVFGIMDFARLLYTWNTANEVSREGARYAVVCADPSSNSRVLARMQALMPDITASNITVAWEPAGCNAANCEAVTVSLTGLNFRWVSPLPGTVGQPAWALPGFSTYLTREMMTYNPLIC